MNVDQRVAVADSLFLGETLGMLLDFPPETLCFATHLHCNLRPKTPRATSTVLDL